MRITPVLCHNFMLNFGKCSANDNVKNKYYNCIRKG